MGYLVPSERSTGSGVAVSPKPATGAPAGCSSRAPGPIGCRRACLQARLDGLPKAVRDIAWKAQTRLCGRYRRLTAAGKKPCLVTTAVAREMAAFLWAIGQQVAPRLAG